MAPGAGGTEVPVDGILARMGRGMRQTFGGFGSWFGPGVPTPPDAPKSVEGRQFAFPVSVNTLLQVKQEGVSYAALRSIAQSTDIVRLLIELRKDQLCALKWSITKRGQSGARRGRVAQNDKQAETIRAFLRSPDRDHAWQEWLRALLDDMYVIDAASIYIQRTRGGDLYALRPMDGATVKRLIDDKGWTPQPPLPAYQQILWGVPASDYTTQELLFMPRNIRTNRLYGYSHVEQIVVTAKTWLARQASNLEYYDSGSVPAGFITAPKDMSAAQIEAFDDLLNVRLSGQFAERKKVIVTPEGAKFDQTKAPAMMDPYDEWLARIACFCFSVPPTPFVKQMNRATADTANISSLETGLGRDKNWVETMLNRIIARFWGDEYEFVFLDKEAQDPMERATIDQLYVQAGVLTPDEVRNDLGLDPLPEKQEAEPQISIKEQVLDPAHPQGGVAQSGVAQGGGGQGAAQPNVADPAPNPAAKTAHDHLHKADRAPLTQPMHDLADSFEAAFEVLRDQTVASFHAMYKSAEDKHPAQDAVYAGFSDALDTSPLSLAAPDLHAAVEKQAVKAAREQIAHLVAEEQVEPPSAHAAMAEAVGKPEAPSVLEYIEPRAVSWAREHAAELISSDGNGGLLADATRNMINRTITQAVADTSIKDIRSTLADRLERDYAFSRQRAELIARTEVRNARGRGAHEGATRVGMKVKKWLLSNNDTPCPICVGNADQNWIPIADAFSGGVEAPLQHPRCACSAVYRRAARP